jgi:hypothetical protein
VAKHDAVADEALRSSFDSAFSLLRGGKPSDAVHVLADAFLGMLRDHPSLLTETVAGRAGAARLPLVGRWPALGANLVPGSVREGAPAIEFVRDRFAMSEALTYYEFAVDVALDHSL